MTPESEPGAEKHAAGASGRLRVPLFIAAALAAGAGAALGAKAFLDSRRKGLADEESGEDLPSVLRRAGLDVAIAATSQAAERLEQVEPQDGKAASRRS